MPFTFTESANELRYAEHGNNAMLRWLLASVGVVAIVASHLFIRLMLDTGEPGKTAQFSGVIAAIFSVLAFCGFGVYCLWLALCTPRQTMVFDKHQQQLLYLQQRPLFRKTRRVYHNAAIGKIEVATHTPEDEPPWFSVSIQVADNKVLQLGVFTERVLAQQQCQQIHQALGRTINSVHA